MFLLEFLSSRKPWQLQNFLAFGLNVASTYTLGSDDERAEKLGFESNKVVSDAYSTVVTPDGFAFAIWGPIFALEAAFSVWQLSDTAANLSVLPSLTHYWTLVNLFQTIWTPLFGKRLTGLSTLALTGIAVSLRECFLLLELNSNQFPYQSISVLPIAMHSTWASIAALLNFNIFLSQKKAAPSTRLAVGYMSLFLAVAYPAYMSLISMDPTPCFVAAWATFAISRKQVDAKKLELLANDVKTVKVLSKALSIFSLAIGVLIKGYTSINY
mmetsp:Transcript_4402/g.5105  ORF Transcript_4402/g.5105 Transcript_4402/m.5105 type:complete len:270 (+) Transcript_4402:116-925(+)|eukprot:CAMPEP_0184020216 /NCGR_PEP_ID=MMETSP0954-20121128/9218_1 /TAXON_ID=627963 /ORGANISM="Aplanochytrium sp, Strain PBS07" /LENGTH=269 /DNA_ID=CAMNT_0026302037 /DNA_START=111 /DNA_END=920 /DNA_ORIENTATION=-